MPRVYTFKFMSLNFQANISGLKYTIAIEHNRTYETMCYTCYQNTYCTITMQWTNETKVHFPSVSNFSAFLTQNHGLCAPEQSQNMNTHIYS